MVISFPVALTLIKLFQMIDFLLFINVELPVNVRAFLSIFDQNILKLIPSFVEINEETIQCSPHRVSFSLFLPLNLIFRFFWKKKCPAPWSTTWER